jgi:hypothetical protein
MPALFLRVHRFTGEAFSIPSMSPLLVEMVDAIAVWAGQDAFPHFLHLIPFLAALAILIGWVADTGGIVAGWIATAGMLTFGLVLQLVILAKNDLAAVAYPLAGVVCLVRGLGGQGAGWLAAGAALFGCGAAMKVTGLVWLGLAWAAVAAAGGSRRWRPNLVWMAGSTVPFLPWMIKSWMITGDPLWPLGASLLPGALWDAQSGAAVAVLQSRGTAGLLPRDFPGAFARALIDHSPVVALVFPAGLLGVWSAGPQVRRIAGFAASGSMLMWFAMPQSNMRYALASFLLLIA